MANSTMIEINGLNYDRTNQLKAFDESKAGVKGLVDAKVTKIPPFFIHKNDEDNKEDEDSIEIPVIDFDGIKEHQSRRENVIAKVRDACEKFGFFQLVNHGISQSVLDDMINGIRGFHEQDVETKKTYYTRDYSKNVLYNSNFDLFQAPAACWRDTLTFIRGTSPNPQELPSICRDIMIKYTDEVMKLGETVYELLSEALGIKTSYLKEIGCCDGIFNPCHYYPPCPEPELTMGSTIHADSGFITILLQDLIGGLQVLYNNHWIHVVPIHGAFVVNVGNLLQQISNKKFVSAYHRVFATSVGPRISVACIFRTHHYPDNVSRLYGPIKELTSEDNPPIYRNITVKDIVTHKHSKNNFGDALHQFML